MFSNTFQWVQSIPRITKLLAPTNIEVRYSGEGAYTMVNEETGEIRLINLPTIPDPATEAMIKLTFGYMFHELGHVYNTDFSVLREAKIDIESILGMIYNLVEDTFVEREISNKFLEAHKYLHYSDNEIQRVSEKHLQEKGLTKTLRVASALIPYVRYHAGQIEFSDFIKNNPVPELDFLSNFDEQLQGIKNSSESLQIAKNIYKELKKILNLDDLQKRIDETKQSKSQNKQNNEQNKSQMSGAISCGSLNNQENDNQGGDNAEDSQEINQEGDCQGGGSEEQGGNQSQSEESSSQQNRSNEEDFKQALQNAITEEDAFKNIRAQDTKDAVTWGKNENQAPQKGGLILKPSSDKEYRVLTREFDEFYNIPSSYTEKTKNALLPDINISQMQSKLIRLFAAKHKKINVSGKRKGKLCGSNLYRLRINDDRVFKQKIESESLNTAITLLIDLSGSMSGGRDKCAVSAAFLFANILERLKIPYEVLGFSTDRIPYAYREKINMSGGYEYRAEAVKIGIFKGYDERLSPEVIGRFCSFHDRNRHKYYYNCNDDGESILMALTRLEPRQERRKLLFVMSDGSPNVDGCQGSETNHLRNVIANIEKAKDYEIYGIGIQTNSVKKYYKNYSVLDKPEELSEVIIKQLTKNIL